MLHVRIAARTLNTQLLVEPSKAIASYHRQKASLEDHGPTYQDDLAPKMRHDTRTASVGSKPIVSTYRTAAPELCATVRRNLTVHLDPQTM